MDLKTKILNWFWKRGWLTLKDANVVFKTNPLEDSNAIKTAIKNLHLDLYTLQVQNNAYAKRVRDLEWQNDKLR